MELGVLFGLGSAAAFGAGDFSGGLASRRVSGLTVAGLAQAIGLVALLILAGHPPPRSPSTGAIAIAAAAGACGGIGLVALYAGLSLGSMGVVTALSGVGSVALPLLLGYALGRAPVSPAPVARRRDHHGGGGRRQRRHAAGRSGPRRCSRHHGRGLLRPLVPAARPRGRGGRIRGVGARRQPRSGHRADRRGGADAWPIRRPARRLADRRCWPAPWT